MAVYKNGLFVDDHWRDLHDGEAFPASGHVIFSLDWWKAERCVFDGSNVPIGLRVEPGTLVGDFADDLPRFALIALDFPKFVDGRAFSMARLLRERHGFKGELRAVGEVLLDQLQAMLRCGFDSFEITDAGTEKALRAGHMPGVSHFYQPARGPEALAAKRAWLQLKK